MQTSKNLRQTLAGRPLVAVFASTQLPDVSQVAIERIPVRDGLCLLGGSGDNIDLACQRQDGP